jgi:hypothetical protein
LQALLWTLTAALLFLSATASQVVTTPDGSQEQENSDVSNNLVEPYEGVSAVMSRSLHEPYTPRLHQEMAQTENPASLFKKPQARTLSIPSFLGGNKETKDIKASTTPNIVEIAPLNDHPLWKVHKYQGINLSPVLIPTAYGPPSESYGPPAQTYGTPESSVTTTPDTNAALSALDNLSGLVSLLPEDGQNTSPSLSTLNSLTTLLPQKSNSGLSLEQLSELVSLVSLLQAKSNGAPASTYGPPNTHGTKISSLVSPVKAILSETASSSGSLLARPHSLLRRPSLLHTVLNALNVARPSENKGVLHRILNPSKNHPLKKYSSSFDSELNSVAKFIKNVPESKIISKEFKKHVVLGKLHPKIEKLGKVKAVILAAPLKVKKHVFYKAGKFWKIIKSIKLHILGKLSALKSHLLSKLAKLVKIGVNESHIPFKLLGKYAANKKHLASKLIKLSADAKHVKQHGIIFAPIVAKKTRHFRTESVG